jgi:hypothetical protein
MYEIPTSPPDGIHGRRSFTHFDGSVFGEASGEDRTLDSITLLFVLQEQTVPLVSHFRKDTLGAAGRREGEP